LRIALVGHGKMGAALLTQWRKIKGHTFFVIDPAADAGAGTDNVTIFNELPSAQDCNFDLVIVAVKPQLIDVVMPAYKDRLAADGFIASIAAGASIARLRGVMGDVPVVRIMPNLPAAIGAGVSGLCADASASDEQKQLVSTLMAAAGMTIWVEDEDKLDRFTALAGSGPGYVFEIARAYSEAAVGLGFSAADARKLVLGTMAGTVAMALGSDETLEALRTSVTSKNGTTAAGLDALNGEGGLSELMRATLTAAYDRAVALR